MWRALGKSMAVRSTPPTASPINRLGEENHREMSLELNLLWFTRILAGPLVSQPLCRLWALRSVLARASSILSLAAKLCLR